MEEKSLNLTLSKKQQNLLNDITTPNIPEIYVLGSTQSGKTFDICLGCILYAQKLYEYDPKELYYGAIIGWSVTTIKGNIADVIERNLEKLGFKKKMKGKGDYDLHWGGDDDKYLLLYNVKFYFFGFNNVLSFNKILGKPLIFIWADESARIYSSFQLQQSFDELPGRQVSYANHPYLKTIHSFNVEGNENHPYKIKYLDNKPKAKHYSFFPYDNPKINTKEAINRVLELFPKGSALQKQKIFNEWCIAEGKVFNKLNVIDSLDNLVFREIGIGIDYGSQNPTTFVPIALVMNKLTKKWCLVRLECFYHNSKEIGDTPTTEFYSKQLRLFMLYIKREYPHVPLTTNVIDSEASHFDNRLTTDNIPHSTSKKGAGSVDTGVQHLQSLIEKEYFLIYKQPSIKMFRDDGIPILCGKDESLIEFESYQYDTIKSVKEGTNCYKKEYDHSIDACLTKDTIITTDKGNFKIIDLIEKKGKVKCYDGVNFVYRDFKDVRLTRKKQDIYKLKLSNGYELKGTYDHPILTTKGYKKLGELTSKDKIICN